MYFTSLLLPPPSSASSPKVSVLTPVYNTKEDYLRECIESILNQTYTDFEFIILNDASTDPNVEAVVKSYADSRIVYAVNDKNLGISETRNKLIKMARGEYLAIFDHDDISLPDRLYEQVSYLDEHPEVGLVSSWNEDFGGRHGTRIISNPEHSLEIKEGLLTRCVISHSACMLRKSVLEKYGIFYEEAYSPAEDYALFCRLLGKTEFYNFQRPLIRYRNHRENTTHKHYEKMRLRIKAIRSSVQREYQELWDRVRFGCFRKKRFRLFGKIPLLKIEEYPDKTTYYLFSKIPLWTITTESWRDR